MFYLVGLGLNPLETHEKNNEIAGILGSFSCYLDVYTNSIDSEAIALYTDLGAELAERDLVESFRILKLAREKDIALLVSGDPLFATTHHSLLLECSKRGIPFMVINNLSIHTVAISLSGLQGYRFGRTITIAKQEDKFPGSPFEFAKKNFENGMHTLVLVDPVISYKDVLAAFAEHGKDLPEQLIVLERLGLEGEKISYSRLSDFHAVHPFCLIVPAKMHFAEEEFVKEMYSLKE